MQNVVTEFTTGLSGETMWGAFAPVVPLIIAVTVFALGLYFIRRAVRKASKAKPGI